GRTDVLGPVKFSAIVPRATLAARLHVECTEVPVGPDLIQRLAGVCPDLVTHLRQLHGVGAIDAKLAVCPGEEPSFHYEIGAKLKKGELTHARLAQPLTHLEAEATCVDGRVPSARLTANYGPGRLTVS